MIVTNVNSGPKVQYALAGAMLTLTVPEIGDIFVDLQEKQKSVQNVVDFSLDRGYSRIAEGVGSWSVATVVIPPIETEVYDTGETDPETGDPITDVQELPLDTAKVHLHLWGLPENLSTEEEI